MKTNEWSKNFDKRQHRRRVVDFSRGTMKCDNDQLGALQWSVMLLLMTEWSLLLHMTQQRLPMLINWSDNPFPVADLNPVYNMVPWAHASQPPQTASQLIQPLLQCSWMWPTDRQTQGDHTTLSVAICCI